MPPRAYIGVVVGENESHWKQAALLFDRIALPSDYPNTYRKLIDIGASDESLLIPVKRSPLPPLPTEYRDLADLNRQAVDNARRVLNLTTLRLAASVQQTFPDAVAIPLLVGPHDIDAGSSRADLLRVVLESLPLPNANTPWQAIRDWRSDEEARMKYRRLRAWISDMARTNISASDLSDRLATLMDDYAMYMQGHHKQINGSRIEMIVTSLAGALENVIKLQLSAVVERLFKLYREEAQYFAAELHAPGREVAYVADAHRRFR